VEKAVEVAAAVALQTVAAQAVAVLVDFCAWLRFHILRTLAPWSWLVRNQRA